MVPQSIRSSLHCETLGYPTSLEGIRAVMPPPPILAPVVTVGTAQTVHCCPVRDDDAGKASVTAIDTRLDEKEILVRRNYAKEGLGSEI